MGSLTKSEQEERDILELMYRLLADLPDNMKVTGPRSFCINRCLYDSVTEKVDPKASILEPPAHVPDVKKAVFRKVGYSIAKCNLQCRGTEAYANFLLSVLTMVLSPTMVHPDALNSTSIEEDDGATASP